MKASACIAGIGESALGQVPDRSTIAIHCTLILSNEAGA